jgi:hypothetical protein
MISYADWLEVSCNPTSAARQSRHSPIRNGAITFDFMRSDNIVDVSLVIPLCSYLSNQTVAVAKVVKIFGRLCILQFLHLDSTQWWPKLLTSFATSDNEAL